MKVTERMAYGCRGDAYFILKINDAFAGELPRG